MALRGVLLRGLALALGLAAALGLAEGVLRGLEAVRDRGDLRGLHVPAPDSPWLYELRPGASVRLAEPDEVEYRINDAGFRDAPRTLAKPPGHYRILVLGDSLTFGYGVAQSKVYTARLEAELADGAPPIEVLNLGVGGYNAYNEAALLAGRGLAYAPDLVLVQFCINDLNDPTLHFDRQTRLALGALPEAAFPNPAARLAPEATSPGLDACLRLRTCALVYEAFTGLAALREGAAALEPTFAPRDGREHEIEWRWLQARYREMAASASRVGAAFGVIAFPFDAQLADPRRDAAPRRLDAMGHVEGWSTIDLLPAFAAADEREPLLLDAWHPSAAGHALAARTIARALRCEGIIPRERPPDCEDARLRLLADAPRAEAPAWISTPAPTSFARPSTTASSR